MSARILIALALLLVVAAPARASDRHPTLAELEHEVMCPTCHTLLELSHAPIAERMRTFIRARIAAGDTKSAIETKLVADFGEGVLAAPPAKGFGLLAWALPLAGLLGAAAVVGAVAQRWRRNAEPPAAVAGDALEPALERRLEQELARFDG